MYHKNLQKNIQFLKENDKITAFEFFDGIYIGIYKPATWLKTFTVVQIRTP